MLMVTDVCLLSADNNHICPLSAGASASEPLHQIIAALRASALNPVLMHEFSPWQVSPLLPSGPSELVAAVHCAGWLLSSPRPPIC